MGYSLRDPLSPFRCSVPELERLWGPLVVVAHGPQARTWGEGTQEGAPLGSLAVRCAGEQPGLQEGKRKNGHHLLSPSYLPTPPAQCGFSASVHGQSKVGNGDTWSVNSDIRFCVSLLDGSILQDSQIPCLP